MLSPQELSPGLSELGLLFPGPEEFHRRHDQAGDDRYRGDEYGGLVAFPFPGVELSLLTVHPRLVELARTLLRTDEIRICSAEAWTKFAGAFDYDQEHHRDFLSHAGLHNVEMLVYLSDVGQGFGPTHLVPTTLTSDVPLTHRCLSRDEYPRLYEDEVPAVGRVGTVLAYRGETVHRATDLTASGGARYTLHCSFRPAGDGPVGRHHVGEWSCDPSWKAFLDRAGPQQLQLFGLSSDGPAASPTVGADD